MVKAMREPTGSMYSLNDFLFKFKIDHFNLFEIEDWINQSLIVRKIQGFVDQVRCNLPNLYSLFDCVCVELLPP